MQKFLISPDALQEETVRITGQDARHISRVLRMKTGQTLSLTNGKGEDFLARILSVRPDQVEARIYETRVSRTESGLDLTICSAMLKDKKMDMVVKHLTQIGITRWIPFFCDRSVPCPSKSQGKKEDRRMDRWQTIARESLKQCRRSCEVEILPPTGFEQMLALSAGADLMIAFWEGSARPLSMNRKGDAQKAVVLIGPEGGFTPKEIERAGAEGFVSYSLGPRILRAETAAICAAGLVQYLLGDMG